MPKRKNDNAMAIADVKTLMISEFGKALGIKVFNEVPEGFFTITDISEKLNSSRMTVLRKIRKSEKFECRKIRGPNDKYPVDYYKLKST